jgi:hypothetical protein
LALAVVTVTNSDFRFGVGDAVAIVNSGQPDLELSIFPCDFRMPDQEVAEEKPIPVLEVRLHHVDVMRPHPALVPLDEPGIERRRVIAPGGTPEVVVALGLEQRRDSLPRLLEV